MTLSAAPYNLTVIASHIDGTVDGNGEIEIHNVAGVREARHGEIAFIVDIKYARFAEKTKASALLVPTDFDGVCHTALIRVENPEASFSKVASLFAPPPRPRHTGIHPTAMIADNAVLGDDVSVGPYTIIEEDTVIGDRTEIRGHCSIGAGSKLGVDCLIYPHVGIREDCRIGDRVILQPGAKIGNDGFGFALGNDGARNKIPQIGVVIIDDDVEIGANSTVDRARFGRTYIGKGVKIDNLVQVAHNVSIGEHSVLVAQVGVAGSVLIGKKVIIGGQAAIAGHLEVCDNTMIGGKAGVTKNVVKPGYMYGFPAQEFQKASKVQAHMQSLGRYKEKLRAKLDAIETRLAELENGSA